MKLSCVREIEQRGTQEFPIGFYHVEKSHPRYHMRAQWHSDMELERVLKGRLRIQLGDQIYEMKQGQAVFIPAGIVHSAEPKDCIYECLVFPSSVLYATPQNRDVVKQKLCCPVLFDNNEQVNRLFEEVQSKNLGYEFQVLGSLYSIIYEAISLQRASVQPSSVYRIEQIKPAIRYIEEHYSSRILLSELAQICSMSPNYFCNLFKETTGQTPMEYIMICRIEAASVMLLTGATVTDTALSCGFNDLSYFIHIFKRHTGISPKQYALGKRGVES